MRRTSLHHKDPQFLVTHWCTRVQHLALAPFEEATENKIILITLHYRKHLNLFSIAGGWLIILSFLLILISFLPGLVSGNIVVLKKYELLLTSYEITDTKKETNKQRKKKQQKNIVFPN